MNIHLLVIYCLHNIHLMKQKLNLRFCKDLKEHAAEIINYQKSKMIPLTYEEAKTMLHT